MPEEATNESIINFFTSARTAKEIQERFDLGEASFKQIVKNIPDYDLFAHRDVNRQLIYILSKQIITELKLKPKIWIYRLQPQGQPYLWVQFPDDVSWDRIIIIPLSDVHYGSFHCDEKLLTRRLKEIELRDNCFTFIPGDLIENALPDSPGGAIFDQKIRPEAQIDKIKIKLAPIAHKILSALGGNHEGRSEKRCDINPMSIICNDLRVPCFNEPFFMNISWKGYIFTFYIQHGSTNAQTEGGKIGKANVPSKFIDFTMFLIMAHVHDKGVNKMVRICRERQIDKEGKIISFDLIEKKHYVITLSSLYGYHGSYAAKKPYVPGSKEKVVISLFANGDYHVPA